MLNCLPINLSSIMAPQMNFNPFGGLLSSVPINFSFMSSMPFFNFMPAMPMFSAMNSVFTFGSTARTSSSNGARVSSSNQNLSFWEKLGYSKDKGIKLAKDAISHVTGTAKWCARFVKNAIARCGLGKYQSGNGKDMTAILSNNSNFKQISPDNVDLKSLPAGTVLVYGAGVSGYHKVYGHTQIITEDGRAASDHIERNIRKPSAIFIPV